MALIPRDSRILGENTKFIYNEWVGGGGGRGGLKQRPQICLKPTKIKLLLEDYFRACQYTFIYHYNIFLFKEIEII